ncbi:MAG: helix-turn-helix transcriptional regulator [Bacillota bacterium]|nr:helix-turn-helix transcriptional regulator [Bacillota bacterium]
MDIGAKIKSRRIELNLRLEDVARALGVANSTVSRWEVGNIKDMRRNHVITLARVLGVPIEFLMSDEDVQIEASVSDTLAAHFNGEKFTEEELMEIKHFIEFVKERKKEK